jgi:hypothetical protein
MAEVKIAKESFDRLIKIREQLAANRGRYDEAWKECARYINPNMSDWDDDPAWKKQGKPDQARHIYETTVQKASNILTDGIQGYAFARNQAWFKIALEGIDDLPDEENAWLQAAEKQNYTQLQKSNFYDEGRAFVKCCADFGTAIMTRTDDVNRQIPSYRTEHLKWCCVDENEFGEVVVLFRDFWISPYEAAKLFGEGNLPKSIRDALKGGKLDPWKFTQVILPPDKYGLDISRKNKPYYSLYWADCDKKKPLKDGWFNIRPFFVWRWSRNLDGDVWGVDSPGMLELPTVMQLNSERADFSRLVQQQARPPLKATEGLKGRVRLNPGSLTYLRAGEDFAPVAATGRIDGVAEDMADMRRMINESFYTDFFLILSQNIQKQKTATEVAGIQGEKAALLSAFYGRLSSEFLEPVLEDIFILEAQAGRIMPPPESLSGQNLRIDMVSPLAQMQQRYLTLGSSQQAMAEIAALAQLRPDILDNVDLDLYVRNICTAFGMDKRVVLDIADVQRTRQARAMQQQAMVAEQMNIEKAKAGAQVMKARQQEAPV